MTTITKLQSRNAKTGRFAKGYWCIEIETDSLDEFNEMASTLREPGGTGKSPVNTLQCRHRTYADTAGYKDGQLYGLSYSSPH
jgi:hypothetical protein